MMSRENILGTALLAVLIGFVGSMGVLAHYLGRAEPVDPDTLCPNDGAPAHTVLLIDRTDPLTEKHLILLSAALERIRTSLATDERLSVFLIEGSVVAAPQPIFSRCRPADGSDANPLYQNGRLLRADFQEMFRNPLSATIAELDERTQAPSSPIMEMVRAVASLPSFAPNVGRRNLIIVSDLLQNVSAYSHYRTTPGYEEFRASAYGVSVLPALKNVEVELVYLPNQKAVRRQGNKHLTFWREYLLDVGASSVSVVHPRPSP